MSELGSIWLSEANGPDLVPSFVVRVSELVGVWLSEANGPELAPFVVRGERPGASTFFFLSEC